MTIEYNNREILSDNDGTAGLPVFTPYMAARSKSSITRWPRMT